MNTKEIVLSEIDSQLIEYQEVDVHSENSGKIDALQELKKLIQSFDEEPAQTFLDLVLEQCDQIPERDPILGTPAASPQGIHGKKVACERIKTFILSGCLQKRF